MKLRHSILALAIASPAPLSIAASPSQPSTTIDELSKTVAQQQQQLNALTAALENNSASSANTNTTTGKTTIGGYGEHHFNHLKSKTGKTNTDSIDIHRFVLFINHQYSDAIEFVSELEVEHGVAGDGEPGEVEVEQAYIHWQLNDHQAVKIGQFLVPVGILNETHEPDTFYGVERNNVEKYIIPTTWWEAGALLNGTFGEGFSYDVGVHSGLSTTSEDIRSGRQKNAKATAETWAAIGRIKYTGVAGLELASTLQWQQDLTQGTADEADAILLEAHAIYQTGPVSIKALYALWDIGGNAAKANGTDEQSGFYIEPSYKISEKLGVFARVSEWDNEAGSSTDTETTQYDLGVNYWIADNVALKADWQDQEKEVSNSEKDGFNLGIGWSF